MVKKICITGAKGFVGKHLIARLEKSSTNEIYSIPHELLSKPYELTERLAIIKPEYVYHLAAAGNIQNRHDDPAIFISNLTYLFNLLQAIKDIPLKGFINVSSSSVLLPYQTTYAATKLGAEALCKAYVDQYDLSIVTLRPFSLYGHGDHIEHLIPKIFRSCLNNEPMRLAKEPMHDWTYIEDFVEAMIAYALKAKTHAGNIVHVGSGKATSNWWLLEEIELITGKKAIITDTYPPRDYDTQEWVARSGLGNVEFTPTSLAQGLQKVYKSFILS